MSRFVTLPLIGLAALASSAAIALPAHADSASLVCQVIPSRSGVSAPVCGTFLAASSYVIDNGVAGGPASGYSWSVPSGTRVVGGCNSTSPFCDLSVRAAPRDRSFVTSVSAPGIGTLSVEADLPAVCGSELC
jgi:hypothetical protein